MIDHIDYSQYASWSFCAWNWYEKYMLRRRKRWPEGLREDALAIGSLVHAGLENWYAKQKPEIPEETIEKVTPTPEALGLCRRLLNGYVQTFPREQWELIRCERPVRFSLIEGKEGLAKIDLYFYIAEAMQVESGLPGYEITLKPGWWIQEYKTKSPATSFADFMHEWTNKMQADFQLLALREHIANIHRHNLYDEQINGLLVNVIEKPKDYVPRRKCKVCQQYWNYSAWQPATGELLACPSCGNQQKLKPVDGEKFEEPRYFKMIVERTPEQLAYAKDQIKCVADKMVDMELWGEMQQKDLTFTKIYGANRAFAPIKEHCFDNSRKWGKECEFFTPHTYGISTIDNDKYEEMEDYINEPTAEVV
jgi:PD-(D/E)XK nuclease superfamily